MFLVARTINANPIRVADHLISEGVAAYCPKEVAWMRNHLDSAGKRVRYSRPLFPGYLFVIRSERGLCSPTISARFGYVVRFVSLAGRYISLTPEDVLSVSKTENDLKLLATDHKQSGPSIHRGDAVVIIRGILSGRKVKIRDVRGRQALVDITDRPDTAPVFVPISDLC